MLKKPGTWLLLTVLVFAATLGAAQQPDRFAEMEKQMSALASATPGLNDKVDFSVSGVSIQEFLRGLAESNNLNINIDPSLTMKVYNNFTNEKVSNILLFLAKEYDLEIRFVGSIMSVSKYKAIPDVPAPRNILVKYNPYNNLLSLDLKEDTLSRVVKKITQVARKNVIFASGLGNRKVSVYLEDISFQNALEKMAFANELKLTRTDDDVYVFESLSEGESSGLLSVKKGSGRPYRPSASRSGMFIEVLRDSTGLSRITLEANNSPVVDVLRAVSEEAGISYFMYSEIKGTTTLNVSNVTFNDFLTYLFRNTEYTFRSDQNLYMIGDRKLEGLRISKVIQLRYRSLETVVEMIPAEIRKNVEIKEFKELNSILLTGSGPQIEEVGAFVKEIDRVVPMVMIEVIMVDVKKGNTIKTGIRAGISDSVKTGGTFLPGVDYTLGARAINEFIGKASSVGSVNIGRVTPSFYVGLSALENNNNVNVRSMPKLSTLNGHEANLSIGSTRYYSVTTQNVLGSLNPQTVVTQQFNPVQANLAISIKPVISGDEQVTLNIDVNISDFLGETPNNQPPPSSTSQFKSIIRVRNEEMVVLGGIERLEKSDNGSGVPVLSRIPVLKWLFSERTRTRQKTVSVVFIKPTIIY
jgi:type IV pilus assembly protein PilQ